MFDLMIVLVYVIFIIVKPSLATPNWISEDITLAKLLINRFYTEFSKYIGNNYV